MNILHLPSQQKGENIIVAVNMIITQTTVLWLILQNDFNLYHPALFLSPLMIRMVKMLLYEVI